MIVKDKAVIKALAMIAQIGISMLTPIFLCLFLGYFIDQHFNTKVWIIVFLFLGIIVAFRNVYYLTKQFYAKEKEREDAELKYFEDLKREREQNKKL